MSRAVVKPRRELEDIEQAVVNAVIRSLERRPCVRYNYRTLGEHEIEEIMRRPAVAAAIQARVKSRLRTELVPAALEVLHQAMTGSGSLRDRITAAKAVIEYSGIGKDNDQGEDKPLAEMSSEEIMSYAVAAKKEMETRAGAGSEQSEDDGTHPSRPLMSLQAQEREFKPQKMQLRNSKKDSIFD